LLRFLIIVQVFGNQLLGEKIVHNSANPYSAKTGISYRILRPINGYAFNDTSGKENARATPIVQRVRADHGTRAATANRKVKYQGQMNPDKL
jgi:hypothetical protein